MMILVSGASSTVAQLAMVPKYRQHLGHLVVPSITNSKARILSTGLPIACDNDCFRKGWTQEKYQAMLDAWLPEGPIFVTVPDHVGGGVDTAGLFDWYAGVLDDAEGEVPLAVVAQDGMEDVYDLDGILDSASALFIGGTTEYKLSRAAADLAREAKARGLWLHMGRVNGLKRIRYAAELGCDSVDGSGYSKFAWQKLPQALDYVAAITREMGLPDRRAEWEKPTPLEAGPSGAWVIWRANGTATPLDARDDYAAAEDLLFDLADRLDVVRVRTDSVASTTIAVVRRGGARLVLAPGSLDQAAVLAAAN